MADEFVIGDPVSETVSASWINRLRAAREVASNPEPLDGAALSRFGISRMQQRPIEHIARELAMAVVEWLASDGNDVLFAEMDALAKKWKKAVVDAE